MKRMCARTQAGFLDILVASIAMNTKAELGKDLPNGRVEIIGNKTEGAMLVFLRNLGEGLSKPPCTRKHVCALNPRFQRETPNHEAPIPYPYTGPPPAPDD